MNEASIALNRFGLGGRPGSDLRGDPRQWLVAQIDRYEARPRLIARSTSSPRIVGQLAAYQRKLAELQQADRETASVTAIHESEPMADAETATFAASGQNAGNDPINLHRQTGRDQARNHYGSAVAARTQMAVIGGAPFIERLTHFWANHFAVSADKLEVLALSGSFEFEAIRPHVLGKFRDMLHAVEHHPAMLLFLDQAQSVGANSRFAQRAPELWSFIRWASGPAIRKKTLQSSPRR